MNKFKKIFVVFLSLLMIFSNLNFACAAEIINNFDITKNADGTRNISLSSVVKDTYSSLNGKTVNYTVCNSDGTSTIKKVSANVDGTNLKYDADAAVSTVVKDVYKFSVNNIFMGNNYTPGRFKIYTSFFDGVNEVVKSIEELAVGNGEDIYLTTTNDGVNYKISTDNCFDTGNFKGYITITDKDGLPLKNTSVKIINYTEMSVTTDAYGKIDFIADATRVRFSSGWIVSGNFYVVLPDGYTEAFYPCVDNNKIVEFNLMDFEGNPLDINTCESYALNSNGGTSNWRVYYSYKNILPINLQKSTNHVLLYVKAKGSNDTYVFDEEDPNEFDFADQTRMKKAVLDGRRNIHTKLNFTLNGQTLAIQDTKITLDNSIDSWNPAIDSNNGILKDSFYLPKDNKYQYISLAQDNNKNYYVIRGSFTTDSSKSEINISKDYTDSNFKQLPDINYAAGGISNIIKVGYATDNHQYNYMEFLDINPNSSNTNLKRYFVLADQKIEKLSVVNSRKNENNYIYDYDTILAAKVMPTELSWLPTVGKDIKVNWIRCNNNDRNSNNAMDSEVFNSGDDIIAGYNFTDENGNMLDPYNTNLGIKFNGTDVNNVRYGFEIIPTLGNPYTYYNTGEFTAVNPGDYSLEAQIYAEKYSDSKTDAWGNPAFESGGYISLGNSKITVKSDDVKINNNMSIKFVDGSGNTVFDDTDAYNCITRKQLGDLTIEVSDASTGSNNMPLKDVDVTFSTIGEEIGRTDSNGKLKIPTNKIGLFYGQTEFMFSKDEYNSKEVKVPIIDSEHQALLKVSGVSKDGTPLYDSQIFYKINDSQGGTDYTMEDSTGIIIIDVPGKSATVNADLVSQEGVWKGDLGSGYYISGSVQVEPGKTYNLVLDAGKKSDLIKVKVPNNIEELEMLNKNVQVPSTDYYISTNLINAVDNDGYHYYYAVKGKYSMLAKTKDNEYVYLDGVNIDTNSDEMQLTIPIDRTKMSKISTSDGKIGLTSYLAGDNILFSSNITSDKQMNNVIYVTPNSVRLLMEKEKADNSIYYSRSINKSDLTSNVGINNITIDMGDIDKIELIDENGRIIKDGDILSPTSPVSGYISASLFDANNNEIRSIQEDTYNFYNYCGRVGSFKYPFDEYQNKISVIYPDKSIRTEEQNGFWFGMPDTYQAGNYAAAASIKEYTVNRNFKVQYSGNSDNYITCFDFKAADNAGKLPKDVIGVIDNNTNTITLTVPYGTNVNDLIPYICVSNKAGFLHIAENGEYDYADTEKDFSKDQTYEVWAENQLERDYTVKVIVEKQSNNGGSIGGGGNTAGAPSAGGGISGAPTPVPSATPAVTPTPASTDSKTSEDSGEGVEPTIDNTVKNLKEQKLKLDNLVKTISEDKTMTDVQKAKELQAALNGIAETIKGVKSSNAAQETLSNVTDIVKTAGTVLQSINDLNEKDKVAGSIEEIINNSQYALYNVNDCKAAIEDTKALITEILGVISKLDKSSERIKTLKAALINITKMAIGEAATVTIEKDLVKVNGDVLNAKIDSASVDKEIEKAKDAVKQIKGELSEILDAEDVKNMKTPIIINVSKTGNPNEFAADIPADVVKTVKDSGFDGIKININKVGFYVTPDMFAKAKSGEKISVSVSTADNLKAPSTEAVWGGLVVPVYKLTAIVGDNKIEKLDKPMQITFDLSGLDTSKYTEQDLSNLTVYALNNDTLKFVAVGGKYDPVTKTVTVYRSRLGNYTVMKSNKKFSDVINNWAKEEINLMLNKGIINETTNFEPDKNITRAEFAAWIARLFGLDGDGMKNSFKDVTENNPYYKEISAAAGEGIITGTSSDTFDPDKYITREEMTTILFRALAKYKGMAALDGNTSKTVISGIKDAKTISSWASSAVAIMYKNGIVKGNTDKSFNAKGNLKKSEAAALIYRIFNMN